MRGLATELSDRGHGAAVGVVDLGGWVAPAMELIYEQGTAAFRGQWPRIEAMLELAPLRPGRGDWPHPSLALPGEATRPARHDPWRRSAAEPSPAAESAVAAGVLHDNPAGRLAALEAAGVALQLISPGPSLDACRALPANLAAGVFAAYNRYVVEYCREDPQRLGAVLQLHGSEPGFSAQEVAELRGEASVRAVSLCLAVRIAPDDRQFEPLWQALQDADLPVLHRPSFCARVWSPGRLLSYLHGAGVLERFPGLRVGLAAGESEHSASDLAGCISRTVGGDGELGSRLFAVASSAQFADGCEDADGMLWASDFPLRGSLDSELERVRGILGTGARSALVASPRRFLGAGAEPPE